ncbi:sensor histidine kinase [Paenibacillus cymbidii]|uniref:sensor histidine kinase n=1 Tax=Paenibacillus cymbidii TaxID=1639034 RepID=UPI001080D72E|nr:histidine kinase [Paenibacillus cymbidii]
MIRSSIRNKLVLFMLVATIIPIAASIVITYVMTNNRVTDETVASSSRLLEQGTANIVNYMNTINKATLSVYLISQGTSLYDILSTGGSDYLSDREIYRAMQAIYYAVDESEQMYLYVAKSKLAYAIAANRSFRRLGDAAVDSAGGLALGEARLLPPHPARSYADTYIPETVVLTFQRSLYDVPSKEDLGLLMVDIRPDVIAAISRQLYAEGQEELYILDRSGTAVYASEPGLIGRQLTDGWVRELQAEETNAGHFRWNGKGFAGVLVYEKMKTDYMDWTIVKRIPNATLSANGRQLTLVNSLVYTLFLLIAIAATVVISIRFTNPIKKLIGYMHRIQTGSWNVAIDIRSRDEFGILARRFADMMQTIDQLVVREYRLALANKTNELKALQAQINPHFLNNALQSIGTLALQREQRQIYSLIAALGKMMRYGMDTNESIVPLAREIDYVKAYIELQKQRFGGQLQAGFAVAADTLAEPVPKMIVQPLVENYFKHGYYRETREGELALSCRLEDGWLVIETADNGPGLAEEALEQLRRRLRQDDFPAAEPAGSSIGLANVLSRLKLTYGDEARMDIAAVEPHGFRVTLRIPPAGPRAASGGSGREPHGGSEA